ncbi:hypothetical protein TRIUR3_04780 [Triticum urartu]|uniref:Uncharacterized protein n=1 Tax=Triticum urartu TaxID=4572 RepID=M7Z0F3_TRIUA|nr:hypothetical protein TRIUR3_04780 [Triticum urartu]
MTLQLQRSAVVSGKEPEPETGQEQEGVAHVYDVAGSGPDGAGGGGATVLQINRLFKDGIGLGGIFHTAIQVYGNEEWSFGYCENGSGVFSCPPAKNPMYTFRESIVLGKTSCSPRTVNQIARELSREWPGASYELLSRNCNHFCNEFCDKLGVPKLPGWVNRFANAGDAALEAAETTAEKLKQAKKEIFTACKAASTYLTGSPSSTPSDADDTAGSASNTLFEGAWIRSIIGISMKPSKSLMNDASSSSDDETSDDKSETDGKLSASDETRNYDKGSDKVAQLDCIQLFAVPSDEATGSLSENCNSGSTSSLSDAFLVEEASADCQPVMSPDPEHYPVNLLMIDQSSAFYEHRRRLHLQPHAPELAGVEHPPGVERLLDDRRLQVPPRVKTAVPVVENISYQDVVATDVWKEAARMQGIQGAPFKGICMANVTAEMTKDQRSGWDRVAQLYSIELLAAPSDEAIGSLSDNCNNKERVVECLP